ncbi:MAG: hypothetical protein JWQ87_3726 [Candidatus Sulfotelmatobacter sp.]|nr:hypothetical protein [Candidatus Sulfotelmatobacter sp.]
MSDHRDRVAFEVDEHMKAVLQFMQENVPTSKLIGVSDSIPQVARLLWGSFPQEPCCFVTLRSPLPEPSTVCATPLASRE